MAFAHVLYQYFAIYMISFMFDPVFDRMFDRTFARKFDFSFNQLSGEIAAKKPLPASLQNAP